jgi:hypothetical protein
VIREVKEIEVGEKLRSEKESYVDEVGFDGPALKKDGQAFKTVGLVS